MSEDNNIIINFFQNIHNNTFLNLLFKMGLNENKFPIEAK